MNNTNLHLGMTYEDFVNDDINNIEIKWDISDEWKTETSLFNNLTNEPKKTIELEDILEYIDRLVREQDYMWYQEYLDSLSTKFVKKIQEYIEFNHPEFLKQDDEIILDETFPKVVWEMTLLKTLILEDLMENTILLIKKNLMKPILT